MQTIRVHTTQNVYIHYPLASVADRILGYLIDSILLIIYAVSIVALFLKLEIEQWWAWTIVGLPFLFYSLMFEILLNGQTPGKYLMKVKVVRLDGTPATVGDYILRWLFRAIDLRFGGGVVAMITIIATEKGQRLGDLVAGTSVIKLSEQSEISSQELFIVAEPEYSPMFTEVRNLTSKDIELIQQALEVNRNTGNSKPVVLITEKIQSLLGIQSDLPPVKFLYTVVKDYNHLTSQTA